MTTKQFLYSLMRILRIGRVKGENLLKSEEQKAIKLKRKKMFKSEELEGKKLRGKFRALSIVSKYFTGKTTIFPDYKNSIILNNYQTILSF